MSKTDDGDYERENADLRRRIAAAEERKRLREQLAELEATPVEAPSMPEEHPTAPPSVLQSKSPRGAGHLTLPKLLSIGVAAIALPVALAVFVFFVVQPRLAESSAQDKLEQLIGAQGAIQPVNRDLVTFTGQEVANANVEQKALSVGDNPTDPPGFIFSNGKDGEKKRVDLYVDFARQTSRDFVLLNQDTLRSMVESGAIDLYIHPIPGGEAFSMYGPEAVAEAIYVAPETSWGYLIDVLKLSAEIQGEALEPGEMAKALAKRAQEAGISGIDRESIQNGTFASWLLSIGNDSRVAAGLALPAIYVNDQPVPTENLDLNNSDALRRYISSQ